MKINWQRLATKEGMESLVRQIRRFLPRLTHALLVSHIQLVSLALVVVSFLVALYLFAVLLYLPPAGVELADPVPLELDSRTVARLILWIDERAEARDEGFTVSLDTLFP